MSRILRRCVISQIRPAAYCVTVQRFQDRGMEWKFEHLHYASGVEYAKALEYAQRVSTRKESVICD